MCLRDWPTATSNRFTFKCCNLARLQSWTDFVVVSHIISQNSHLSQRFDPEIMTNQKGRLFFPWASLYSLVYSMDTGWIYMPVTCPVKPCSFYWTGDLREEFVITALLYLRLLFKIIFLCIHFPTLLNHLSENQPVFHWRCVNEATMLLLPTCSCLAYYYGLSGRLAGGL